MHELSEVMEKSEKIKEIKECLVDKIKEEISMKGLACVSTEELGQAVDMVKDLAETEEKCLEAIYYQKVVEAMENEQPRYDDYMGYNPNRYRSGRYAPKGMGTRRMGYDDPYSPEWYDPSQDPEWMNNMMGYNDGRRGSSNTSGNLMDHERMQEPRYGKAYNEYLKMRRHYTETKSQDDRKEMDVHAEEHMNDTITTMRDIWKDADPTLRKRMYENLSKLVAEMKQ